MFVAVVTGASRGLGRQIALTLSKYGYNVAVNYLHSKTEAEEVVSAIGKAAIAVKADMGDIKQVATMAEMVYEKWGRIDALINNAGIAKDGMLIKYSESDWDEILRVNLKGCFNATKLFAPLMMKTGGGHIINISSYSGLRGKAGQAAYSASKAAVTGLTYTMAEEFSIHNIRVNAILPGYLPTEMGEKTESAMRKAGQDSLLKKLSSPQEAADFIIYLLTTRNITGQVFSLDSRI